MRRRERRAKKSHGQPALKTVDDYPAMTKPPRLLPGAKKSHDKVVLQPITNDDLVLAPVLPPPLSPSNQMLSSFWFQYHTTKDQSLHLTPTSPSGRRVISPRPRHRPKFCDPLQVIRPRKYVTALLKMNIERAINNSAGGHGGWVRDVCFLTATNATKHFWLKMSLQ